MSQAPSGVCQFDLVCLDRTTGKILWQRTVRQEQPHEGHHRDGIARDEGDRSPDAERVDLLREAGHGLAHAAPQQHQEAVVDGAGRLGADPDRGAGDALQDRLHHALARACSRAYHMGFHFII